MAEIATIARPYAEALFKACGSEASEAVSWLDALVLVAVNPQLQQFADNPKINTEQLFQLITGVVKTPLPEKAKNFLRTVIDGARLAALPEIARQFLALKNNQSGCSDAKVYSAFALHAPELDALKVVLEKKFARRLNLHVEIEPALIGGVRVVVGDEVLDTSVRARLDQMTTALMA